MSGQPTGRGGSLSGAIYVPGSGGASTTTTGVRPLTPKDIATMQANQAAELGAGLVGPFTPEAIKSGYASMVAQLWGVNHPNTQKWVALAQGRGWDSTTFARYLRSQPGFVNTDVGQKMRADILGVLAQVFGQR